MPNQGDWLPNPDDPRVIKVIMQEIKNTKFHTGPVILARPSCVRCRRFMEVVASVDHAPVAYSCLSCSYIWQIVVAGLPNLPFDILHATAVLSTRQHEPVSQFR